ALTSAGTRELTAAARAGFLPSRAREAAPSRTAPAPLWKETAGLTRARVTWFERHRPVPPMHLPGRHNQLNALAAAAVGRAAGLSDEAIEAGVRSFQGVEHRLELVGEWRGARWVHGSHGNHPHPRRPRLHA